jgi:eukaryotic-like serine/threonine-protein kinase
MNFRSPSQQWYPRSIGDQERYMLEQRLGHGGMGNVYVATDTLLGRQVAIKILKETLISTEAIRKRFEREVSLCAALHSENIVQVSDYGITPEGHPFFVMELLVGQTLAQLMQHENVLSPTRAVQIMSQICHGLNLAHSGVILHRLHGRQTERIKVIHRDLKPENLFLVPTTLGELVKILDFGIAKLKTPEESLTDLNTSSFIGTYHYASPEQLELSSELDIQSDIYSLGIILYEMLSGTDPFGLKQSPTHRGVGMSWIKAHLTQTPIPLRSQAGCGDVSPELEAAVMRCLAKAPADRWDSVVSLSLALKSAIGLTPPPPDPSQFHSGHFDTTLAPTNIEFSPKFLAPQPDKGKTSLPNDQVSALEKLLAEEIGPIATVILPQVLAESATWLETVNRLISRIPESHRLHFQEQAIALEHRLTNPSGQASQTVQRRPTTSPSLGKSRPGTQTGLSGPQLTEENLKLIEQRFAHYVGPIAKLVFTQVLNQNQNVTAPDLVLQLAQKIPDPRSAEEFQRSLSIVQP